MTDPQLRPLAWLHHKTHPQPPYRSVLAAAKRGALKAEKLYGDWWTSEQQYRDWLIGWPHPKFGNPRKPRD